MQIHKNVGVGGPAGLVLAVGVGVSGLKASEVHGKVQPKERA